LEIIAENPARTDAEIMAFMFEATQYRHSVVDLLDIVAEARRWYVEDNCTDNQINREAVQ
jgi:hypothetical protein